MPWEVPITVGDNTYPVQFNTENEPTQADIDEAVTQILRADYGAPAEVEDTGQGRFTSALSNVGRGALSIIPGAVGGLGYLAEPLIGPGLKKAGAGIEKDIETLLPVNPAYEEEFSQKAAGAIGQAGGMLLTGGVAGALGKGAAAARGLGAAEAAAAGTQLAGRTLLGSGFLSGSREGGQAAERYGMEGVSAYTRALLGGAIEGATEKYLFGLGSEVAPIGRVLGLGGEARGLGNFLTRAAGTEAGEEAVAQVGGNIATKVLAPEGVETPGIGSGVGEAAALGGIAGLTFGAATGLLPSGKTSETGTPEADQTVTVESGEMPIPTVLQNMENAVNAAVRENADVLPLTAAEVAEEPLQPAVEEAPVTSSTKGAESIPFDEKVGLITDLFSLKSGVAQPEQQVDAARKMERLIGAEEGSLEFVRSGNSKVFRDKNGFFVKLAAAPDTQAFDDLKRQIDLIKGYPNLAVAPEVTVVMEPEGGGAIYVIKQAPVGIEGLLVSQTEGFNKNDQKLFDELQKQNPLSRDEGSNTNPALRVETDSALKNMGLVVGPDGMVRAVAFDFDGITEEVFDKHGKQAEEALLPFKDSVLPGVPLSEFSESAQKAILSAQKESPAATPAEPTDATEGQEPTPGGVGTPTVINEPETPATTVQPVSAEETPQAVEPAKESILETEKVVAPTAEPEQGAGMDPQTVVKVGRENFISGVRSKVEAEKAIGRITKSRDSTYQKLSESFDRGFSSAEDSVQKRLENRRSKPGNKIDDSILFAWSLEDALKFTSADIRQAKDNLPNPRMAGGRRPTAPDYRQIAYLEGRKLGLLNKAKELGLTNLFEYYGGLEEASFTQLLPEAPKAEPEQGAAAPKAEPEQGAGMTKRDTSKWEQMTPDELLAQVKAEEAGQAVSQPGQAVSSQPAAEVQPPAKLAAEAKAGPASELPKKFQGVLWGKKASMGDVWMKLTDNVSDAEMKRRQKEGWQVVRLAKGQHPDDYKAPPKPQTKPEDASKNQVEETGGTPPVESQPPETSPEGEAQEGASQRSREGEEVTVEKAAPGAEPGAAAEGKYSIYPYGDRWAVQGGETRQKFGDYLFPTKEEAEAYVAQARKMDEANEQARKKQEQAAIEESKKKQALAEEEKPITDWLADEKPMLRARKESALKKLVNTKEGIMPIWKLIQERIERGYTIVSAKVRDESGRRKLEEEIERLRKTAPTGNENHPQTIRLRKAQADLASGGPFVTERRFQSPEGAFLDEKKLTKTGMDFAQHLLALKEDKKEAVSESDISAEEESALFGKPQTPEFGSTNTIFTKERAEEARKVIKRKLGQTNVPAFDPELFSAATNYAGYLIEGGVRKFGDFSTRMISEFGEVVRPILKSVYSGIRELDIIEGMDDAATVNAQVVGEAAPAPAPAAKPQPAPVSTKPVEEVEVPEQVSIANAPVDAARAAVGLPPMERPVQEVYHDKEMWADAEAAMKADPDRARYLVTSLVKQPRTISPLENAILLREMVARMSRLQEASNNLVEATIENKEAARQRYDDAVMSLSEIQEASALAGAEQGRSLRARRFISDLNYSLASMTSTLQGAQQRKLTNEEVAEVKAESEKINKAIKELEDLRESEGAAAEEESVFAEVVKEAQAEARLNAKEAITTAKAEIKAGKSLIEAINEKRDAARARIRKRGGSLNVGLNPADLVDYAIIAASYIAEGAVTLKDVTAKMIKEFGAAIEQHMPKIFSEAQVLKSELDSAAIEEPSEATEKPKGKKPALEQLKEDRNISGRLVYEMVKEKVKSGLTTLDAVFSAITKDVQTVLPEITERELRDLFSGYGKVKFPSQEELPKKVRELRRLAQLASAIEDAKKKIAPLRSGPQRDEASLAVREAQKELHRIMKEQGIQRAPGPRALKSALDAAKTRLRNQIEELEKQVKERKRAPAVKKDLAYDQETKDLISRRDALQATLDEIAPELPPTPQELIQKALKDLDKAIAELERRVKERDISQPARTETPLTEQLQVKRDQRDALRNQLKEIRIEIEGEPYLTQEQVNERFERNLARQIDELERQIAEKDFNPAQAQKPENTAAIIRLKARRDALREQRDILKEQTVGKKVKSESERIDIAVKALEKSIDDLNERISKGDVMPKAREDKTPQVAKVRNLRAERDSLRSVVAQMRKAKEDAAKDPEEEQIRRDRQYLESQIKAYQKKLASGDFRPRPKKAKEYSNKLADKTLELEKLKAQWAEKVFIAQLNSRGKAAKAYDFGKQVLHTSRAVLTSFDVSAVFRQGGFITLGNPVRAFRNLKPMFESLASERAAQRTKEEIESRPNFRLYKQSKLYLAEFDQNKLNQQEETFMSRWLNKIPTALGGGLVRGSQRAYVTFLNRLRADTFDAMLGSLQKGPEPTPEEIKSIADYINIATGRGDLGKFQQAGEALNVVFFAPRLVASRFQILGGYPAFKASGRTKALVLREYAKFLTGAAIVYAIGMALQDEEDKAVELDPRSSDFLKLRYGDTRVDPLGGLIQASVFLSRIATGEKKQLSGKVVPIRDEYRLLNLFRERPRKDKVRYGADNTFDVGANFLRSKFSPSFGAAVDVLTGETVVGDKVTPTEVGYKMVMPITFGETAETLEAHGMPAGAALTITSLFGMGVQTYD